MGGWAKGEEFRQEESQGIQAQIKGDAVSECDTRCSQGVTPNAGYKCYTKRRVQMNRVSGQSEGMETWTSPGEAAEEEKKDMSLAGPGIMDQGESERLVPEMILTDVCLQKLHSKAQVPPLAELTIIFNINSF